MSMEAANCRNNEPFTVFGAVYAALEQPFSLLAGGIRTRGLALERASGDHASNGSALARVPEIW